MPDQQEIFAHVKTTLAELFDIPESDIRLDSELGADLDIDSIDAVDLVVELKKYIGKKISPEDFKAVRTVADIVNAVDALMQDG